MKKILFILTITLISQAHLFSQKTIHNYAYLIIPEQFSFQETPDEHQLNSLTKFLFEKQGMKVFLDTEKIPKEYRTMDCAGLKLKMNKKSSMLRTKTQFNLLSCDNTIIFSSDYGSSSAKDFKKGYQESIRNAFKSFAALHYKYVPLLVSEKSIIVKDGGSIKGKGNLISSKTYRNDSNLTIEIHTYEYVSLLEVLSSESAEYVMGDVIGKLFKTSLPNVFRAEWKDTSGVEVSTIAYYDENKLLHVDLIKANGLSVMKFTQQDD